LLVQLCPSRESQTPDALHVLVSTGQLSGSSALVTDAQTPREPATLHAWHVPHTVASQQTPSVHVPVSHPVAHELPRTWNSQVSNTWSESSPPPARMPR
jgi:hypothetical protein